MNNSTFHEKLNKLSGSVYKVEEEITMPGTGVYEHELMHDNIYEDTIYVFSGPGKTGSEIPYTLTVPSDAPWKHIIYVSTSQAKVYISYDTPGDQVEADDINKLQREILYTQDAISDLEEDTIGSRSGYTWNRLRGESSDTDIVITAQPQSQTVTENTPAIFAVTASGTNITYKWQYMDVADERWRNFVIGAASTLTVTPTIAWNERRIRCVLSNTSGTFASDEAILTVTPAE